MTDIINGYELLREFTSENAGFCRWTFAKKNGKEYFLKEFVDPIYPMNIGEGGLTNERIINDRKSICRDFENTKLHLYEEINKISDGNLIRIEEFFRYDARYYIAMPRVPNMGISVEEIASSPVETRIQLCRTLAHSVMRLHDRGIVHADIKPSNVIIKRTRTGRFAAQIIDFDCSFFQMNPPKNEDDLHGDQVYLSPEGILFMIGEYGLLTCQMDVFALGIMFHEYLTGEIPGFNEEEYDYPCEALLEDDVLTLSDKLDEIPGMKQLIGWMLEKDAARRIPMLNVFEQLGGDPELSFEMLHRGFGETEEENEDPNAGISSRPGGGGFHAAGAGDLL